MENDKKKDKARNNQEITRKKDYNDHIQSIKEGNNTSSISNTNPPPRFPPKGRDKEE